MITQFYLDGKHEFYDPSKQKTGSWILFVGGSV